MTNKPVMQKLAGFLEATTSQKLFLDRVLRSGNVARRCWYRWKDQMRSFRLSPKRRDESNNERRTSLIQCRDQNGPDAPKPFTFSSTVA
eukprot:1801994-Pleurochrysis_carterae.AAC.1